MPADLARARAEVTASSAGGSPFLAAFGLTLAVTGMAAFWLPTRTAALVLLFQGNLALPLAFWWERRVAWGVLSRENPLRQLSVHLAMSQIAALPVVLVLPGAVRAIAPAFYDTRRVWFGLQALVLGGAFLALAYWVGSGPGQRIALLALLAWATPITFASLQMGNFQITAVPLAMMGMMLAWSRREPAGAALLAFTAAGKVFPSMLVLHAAALLRWRTVAWIAAAGVAFAAATAAVFGLAPFVQFVRDEFPRLVSGASFPQMEVPGVMPVNMSVYGLTAKMRQLGAAWLDPSAGKHLSQLYALLLAVFAVWTGHRLHRIADRDEPGQRLRLAILWLAIINFASLGGPFVPVMYGIAGTLWLLTLLAAAAETRSEMWTWIALFAALTAATLIIGTPRPREIPAAWLLILSVVTQAGIFSANLFAAARCARAFRPARIPGLASVPAV